MSIPRHKRMTLCTHCLATYGRLHSATLPGSSIYIEMAVQVKIEASQAILLANVYDEARGQPDTSRLHAPRLLQLFQERAITIILEQQTYVRVQSSTRQKK